MSSMITNYLVSRILLRFSSPPQNGPGKQIKVLHFAEPLGIVLQICKSPTLPSSPENLSRAFNPQFL